MSAASPPSLESLPDEVLRQILSYISPRAILVNVQRLSKRYNTLGNEPLLWRHHCRVDYKHWDSKHRIKHKFLGQAQHVDWKALYLHRRNVDTQTTELLDSILEGQTSRLKKFDLICGYGYDAKEILLRHCAASDNAEDVLARRYYASAVLDTVHRSKALEEWHKLATGESVAVERALGSFDLFVLHDQVGDLLEIGDLFDEKAVQFRSEHPGFDRLSTRKRALAVATYLRAHNLTGLDDEVAYRDLQNNYIGVALQDPDHPSLPLISVAIFCGIAGRLGLDARCCGIPNHVHAMVFPNGSEDLDGRSVAAESNHADPMYLDPWRSDAEVPASHLREILSSWGIQPVDFAKYISDTPVSSLVLRTSKNILATVHEFRLSGANITDNEHPTIRLYANPFADLDNSFYSALWANFLLSDSETDSDAITQHQFVPMLLEKFERFYPMDASLIEQYVCPLFDSTSGAHWQLYEALRIVRAVDQSPKQIKPRDSEAAKAKIKYKVGQVFRHKRYRYIAVITGWDIECGMSSAWIEHNQVDDLSGGRHQSFYHSLVEDTSIRYVAEESIEIIEPQEPTSLMSLAGQYFKRWDKERRVFVSNIRDEYPDD